LGKFLRKIIEKRYAWRWNSDYEGRGIEIEQAKLEEIVGEAKKDVEKVMSEFPNMSAWNNPEIGYKMYVVELEDWFKNKLKPVVDRWFS